MHTAFPSVELQLFVFGPRLTTLFGRIRIHYSAHYSVQIEYKQYIWYRPSLMAIITTTSGTKTNSLDVHCGIKISKHDAKCKNEGERFSYLSTFGRHPRQIGVTERRLRSLSSLPDNVPCYHWNPFLCTEQYANNNSMQ